mmetsp:Transcript_74308/g.204754  ORF Transcript_74308/g.204754 Transcript_74308/m.204754 type:complete len:273 (+) Transcript_74308:265-1083(+)
MAVAGLRTASAGPRERWKHTSTSGCESTPWHHSWNERAPLFDTSITRSWWRKSLACSCTDGKLSPPHTVIPRRSRGTTALGDGLEAAEPRRALAPVLRAAWISVVLVRARATGVKSEALLRPADEDHRSARTAPPRSLHACGDSMDSFRLRATRMHHAHEGGRASRRTHCSARTHTPRRRVQATRASARAPPTTHERVAAALGSSSLRRKSVEARSMSCASPSWPEPSSKASKTARSRSESEPLSAVARAATSSRHGTRVRGKLPPAGPCGC